MGKRRIDGDDIAFRIGDHNTLHGALEHLGGLAKFLLRVYSCSDVLGYPEHADGLTSGILQRCLVRFQPDGGAVFHNHGLDNIELWRPGRDHLGVILPIQVGDLAPTSA